MYFVYKLFLMYVAKQLFYSKPYSKVKNCRENCKKQKIYEHLLRYPPEWSKWGGTGVEHQVSYADMEKCTLQGMVRRKRNRPPTTVTGRRTVRFRPALARMTVASQRVMEALGEGQTGCCRLSRSSLNMVRGAVCFSLPILT